MFGNNLLGPAMSLGKAGSTLSFSKILGGASKTLGFVNKTLPLYYQIKPMFNNAKTVLNMYSAMGNDKKEGKKEKITNDEVKEEIVLKPSNDIKPSENNINNKIKNNKKKDKIQEYKPYRNDTLTFFQ